MVVVVVATTAKTAVVVANLFRVPVILAQVDLQGKTQTRERDPFFPTRAVQMGAIANLIQGSLLFSKTAMKATTTKPPEFE